MADSIQFLGRLHPLVLHLPIGILVLAFLMECVGRIEKYQGIQPAISFVLLVGMCSAIVTAFSGYVLSWEGGYEETTLNRHQWLGIATAVLAMFVYFFYQRKNSKLSQQLYFPTFLILMILIGITGHLGGSLTHGSDFLTAPFSEEIKTEQVAISNMDSALVFHDIIKPIIKQKCISCHNESKIKGELLLTSIEGIKKGGKTGAFFVKGDIENSLFLQRAHLPLEDKKHMPPKGKKQLNKDEIALLEWWVSEDADFEKTVGVTRQPEAIKTILAKYTTIDESVFALQIEPISEGAFQKIKQSGIDIEKVAKDKPFVKVSLRGRQDLSKKTFNQLKQANDQLIEIDLSKSNLTDDMLSRLSNFPHLRKLSLQQTDINGKELKVLKQLKYLEHLNLYRTAIEDDAIEIIEQLSNLKDVFLWQTKVSDQAIKDLKNERPLLQVNTGVDQSIFSGAQLKPPVIVVEKDIFTDSIKVVFDFNFKNVDLLYTLDGSLPDSTSKKYIEPLQLTQTADIRVIAKKAGWETSIPAEKTVVRAKYKPKSIELKSPPDDRYKADGAPSLINFKKGTAEFAAGEWLGYEGKNMAATLKMPEMVSVSNVAVSALEATGSYIFFPKKIRVLVSNDGKNFQSVAEKIIPTTGEPKPTTLQNFILNFDTQEVRFIKVEVKSNLINPKWHPAPGAPCWIFIDEIVVG